MLELRTNPLERAYIFV